MKPILSAAVLALALLSGTVAAATSDGDGRSPANALTTVTALDVPKYMGTWYEIAKYPNRFQRRCVEGTRAEYKLLGEGRVQVTNRCRTETGAEMEAAGEARQIGSASSPKLEVRFAPAWLSFLPFVWGDYWVVNIDDAYQLVAVSEPQREYLWILSRTPTVEPARLEALSERLRQLGFDLHKLEFTQQFPEALLLTPEASLRRTHLQP